MFYYLGTLFICFVFSFSFLFIKNPSFISKTLKLWRETNIITIIIYIVPFSILIKISQLFIDLFKDNKNSKDYSWDINHIDKFVKICLIRENKKYYIFTNKNNASLPPIGSKIQYKQINGTYTMWMNLVDGVSLPKLVSDISENIEVIKIKNENTGYIWTFNNGEIIDFKFPMDDSEEQFDPTDALTTELSDADALTTELSDADALTTELSDADALTTELSDADALIK